MKLQEILSALQSKEISPKDAEIELSKIKREPELTMDPLDLYQFKSRFPKRQEDSYGLWQQQKNVEKNEKSQQQFALKNIEEHYGLVLSTVHSLSEISLQQWIVPEPERGAVTIQVRASAINFPDTMCVTGLYPTIPEYPFVPGFEVSGIVSRVGGQVSDFNIGDEVIAITGKQMGGHASHVNVPITNIVHKPRNISFEEACSLPVVFGTAYYAFKVGKLAPREHVLIQTATGGCGLIAIQLARLKRCVCYGTSSKQAKLDILKKIEVPYAINYKTDFDQEISRITNNRGVDVVLNMLSGDGIQKGLNCLAPFGRYLEIAVHALKTSPKIDLSRLVQNQSIYSLDLRRLALQKNFNCKEMLNLMVSMIQSEKIVPIVSRIYPICQIKEALAYVSQGQHIGKVVISHVSDKMEDCTDHCIQRLLEQKHKCETGISFIEKTENKQEEVKEEIAIIGISGQFPKSTTLTAFWDNLARGVDCISEIPPTRWSIDQHYHPDTKVPGKTYCKWMGVLEDVDKFDPLFFNISPAEAELMDPQQRLFLENCWQCIEDAGLSPSSLSGSRCGVFVGCATSDYGQNVGSQVLSTQGFMGTATSILTARISYILNLKGPCLAIETACSSSLVAIAEACNSLILHTSDLALAGGVCIMAGPSMHIITSKAGMISADGRCFTFDNRANGFVPGEGVGVVLLKRLSDAVRGQDPIYGVIRGWGINQDGKTNGITAPSVNSQILLEKEVYKRFNINPETISLVEAHGTGTKLGDPIETEALTETFQSYTDKKNYCALGSVKSNIGHLLTASGVAGVIKVLLALQHHLLPPTINFQTLNEHIVLDNSPFYINTELRPWETTPGLPRRAAVSSFGFSGTNAHLVIEEYSPARKPLPDTGSPILFVLSAKNEKQLKIYAERMKNHIELHEDINMADMAYTLQVGRDPMDYRLTFLADSRDVLIKALEGFLNDNPPVELLTAQIKKSKDGVAVYETDDDAKSLLQTWFQKKKLKKIADLWVKGLSIDWNNLYPENKPQRIPLPTYPFARERYWMQEIGATSVDSGTIAAIHPLLQQNTSDFSEQRFTSIFTGQEFFLADHAINGRHLLPGVAYLEMARTAIEQATGALQEEKTMIRLRNIIWARPITIEDHPVHVHIGLYPEDTGEIAYEIYGESKTDDAEPIVYSQGVAVLDTAREAPTLDISVIKVECNQIALSSNQCYETFKFMGIDYGPAYQGIEQMYMGQNQALARLAMPLCITSTKEQFIMHPSLMDAALQASIGLTMSAGETTPSGSIFIKPSLPFALEELQIFGNCAFTMWAYIRPSNNSSVGDRVQKIDIDLCDDQGKICVGMKGLEYRPMEFQAISEATIEIPMETELQSSLVSQTQEAFELMTFEEVWQEQGLSDTVPTKINTIVCFLSNPEHHQTVIDTMQIQNQRTKIIFISQGTTRQKQSPQNYIVSSVDPNTYQDAFQSIRQDHGNIDAILYLWPLEDQRLILDYSCIVHIIQATAFTGLKPGRILLAAQYENELDRCYLESWIGFERSLGLILPHVQLAAVIQEVKESRKPAMKDWLHKLMAELKTHKVQSVLYQEGKRHVCRIKPTALTSSGTPLRQKGTCLITGGCGELGFLFAKHLARVQGVNLILTGRSPMNAEKQSKIKTLEDLGSQVLYIQADVCDQTRMKEGLKQAKERFGEIRGVIHAAGIQGIQSILENNLQSFQKVLAPKIQGTLTLDELLQDEPLDFICYFSSSSAILGDFGSCDYAVANRFLMAYAHYHNHQQRQGRAIAINWPLWKDGGMGFKEDESTEMYLKSSGQYFLETEEGLAVFDSILFQTSTQHLILVGQPNRVNHFLGLTRDQTPAPTISISSGRGRHPQMKGLSLEQCLEWDLKELIGNLLKIPRDKLENDENLADCGFDSISLAQFATLLTNHYEIEIIPALLFGYSTIEKLTQYFLTEHRLAIQEFYQEDLAVPTVPQTAQVTVVVPAKRRPSARYRFTVGSTPQSVPEPIAVIGMSGRFPGADTTEQLWNNLKDGKECITEIPGDRWDWRKYHGDHLQEVGKAVSRWGGFISNIDRFDPLFFEISPREAEAMDPQQRLFLEEAWHALEDAGYMGDRIKGASCGVYVGVEESQYGILSGGKGQINSNQNATLSARIAYALDLKGPNLALTAACSSGLVAIHQACQVLRQGDCDMVLVGGVNLLVSPATYIALSQTNMLSPDGKCYVFDRRANGLVPGEAVAVVLLKPLSKAILDKDHIYGCIKASGVNYDGRTNGIMAPSPLSQADLIKSIYKKHHTDPNNIQYIMAHSVGSKLGDPIEVQALTNAFGRYTDKKQYCTIGSIKPLIGHTFAASGVVSLIAMLMAMKHRLIPALLNYESKNEYINFNESPFIINKENQAWVTENNQPRLGAISTAGISGTNAHAVIEEYLPSQENINHHSYSSSLPQIMVFSAKNQNQLQAVVEQILEFFELKEEIYLPDIAYTLQVGREAMESRLAMVLNTKQELIQGLNEYLRSVKEGQEIESPISIFTGNIEECSMVTNLLSGKLAGTVAQALFIDKNLEKLAFYWAQGGKIDWEQLHQGEEVRIISLPTYPFVKQRCWIETLQESDIILEPNKLLYSKTSVVEKHNLVKEFVVDMISRLLGVPATDMDINKSLVQYGFNSILRMSLFQHLKSQIDPSLTLDKVIAAKTTREVINVLQLQKEHESILLKQEATGLAVEAGKSILKNLSKFPELIHLNRSIQGRPVFWFHGGLGGVESYPQLAHEIQRPFYAIQARGWMTERVPLHGIQAMASYYTHIIQSVQQEGPYDLGGYSLGGAIAYEVTRQLQELGQIVDTIVMLDSLDSKAVKKIKTNDKSTFLAIVNTLIITEMIEEPGRAANAMIHRDEINFDLKKEVFSKNLINLAKERGLIKPENQLQSMLQKHHDIQRSLDNFSVLPLSNPQSVTCYYFRNKSGMFFGELEPYYSVASNFEILGKTKYWKEWEQQLHNFYVIDIDSPNHMTMLSEQKSYEVILAFCKKLYSEEGMSIDLLKKGRN